MPSQLDVDKIRNTSAVDTLTIDASGNTTLGGNLVLPSTKTIKNENNNNVVSVTSTGNVTVGGAGTVTLGGSGNLVLSGSGIDFGTGTDGTGTVTGGVLDDYEEGTFTPAISGSSSAGTGTYTIPLGTYVKVGNLVHVNIRLGWSAHTGSGGMLISGLPFTSSNTYANLGVSYRDGLVISAGHTCNVSVIPNNTVAYIYEIATSTDNASLVSMDTSVPDIAISGTYTVA